MQAKTKAMHRWISQTLASETDRCLRWPFGRSGAGYGKVTVDGKQRDVHRLICERAHGEPPSSVHVAAHSCGRKVCANPRHLRWATRSENEIDKLRHGTAGTLTEAEVCAARASHGPITIAELARRYSVAYHTMHDAITGATWRHLPGSNHQ